MKTIHITEWGYREWQEHCKKHRKLFDKYMDERYEEISDIFNREWKRQKELNNVSN